MESLTPRVLVFEDEPGWQRRIQQLQPLAGLAAQNPDSVKLVSTLEEAVQLLESQCFDLAVTDVFVEGESEFEWRFLAEKLRTRNVPIIVVSGLLRVKLITTMVNNYNIKGLFNKLNLDPQEFQRRVAEVLGIGNIASQPDYAIRNVVTWLHLSDLHCKGEEDWDQSIVLEALWDDIEKLRKRSVKPDLIIFSGDIAYSGKSEEYTKARKFFDILLARTELTRDRLFIVPGNHDVNRGKIAGFGKHSLVLNSRDRVRDVLEDKASLGLLVQRLEDYTSFAEEYSIGVPDSSKADNLQYYTTRTIDIAGKRISLIGLNSALISGTGAVTRESDDKGDLIIGERQVREAIRMAGEADVKIAVVHHPLSYLQDFDATDVKRELRKCDLLLHGHLHQTDVERKIVPGGELATIPAGAVFQGRNLVNSYNIVSLDIDRRRGRIMFRRYSDVRQEWLKDLDPVGEDADGEWDIVLPS